MPGRLIWAGVGIAVRAWSRLNRAGLLNANGVSTRGMLKDAVENVAHRELLTQAEQVICNTSEVLSPEEALLKLVQLGGWDESVAADPGQALRLVRHVQVTRLFTKEVMDVLLEISQLSEAAKLQPVVYFDSWDRIRLEIVRSDPNPLHKTFAKSVMAMPFQESTKMPVLGAIATLMIMRPALPSA